MAKQQLMRRALAGLSVILLLLTAGCQSEADSDNAAKASDPQASGSGSVERITEGIMDRELSGLQGEEREAVRRIMTENLRARLHEAQSEDAEPAQPLDQQALEALLASRLAFLSDTCEQRRKLYDSGSISQMVRAEEIEMVFLRDLIRELAAKYFANPAFAESEMDRNISLLMDYGRLQQAVTNPAGEDRGMMAAYARTKEEQLALEKFVMTMVHQLFRQLADAYSAEMFNDEPRFDWESRSRDWQKRWRGLQGEC